MMQQYNYNLTDLDNMIPWERDLYSILLMGYLEDEKQRLQQQQQNQ